MHARAGWSDGVAFGCRPEFGDKLNKLNQGLFALKNSSFYKELCANYSDTITCTTKDDQFDNVKTDENPATATHPDDRADIVIGTEADWGVYNGISDGELVGFDVELIELVCGYINKKCAIVTVPWQSVWPKSYEKFGWKTNPKTYPGVGLNNAWFHCSVGTRNMISRQQSTAFTSPYTDMAVDTAGFVAHQSEDIPVDGANKKVGILTAQAFTTYFKSQMGVKFQVGLENLTEYDLPDDLWRALETGEVEAVYTGRSEAAAFLANKTDLENYTFIHEEAGWSQGVAFGCRPEFGATLDLLNRGLTRLKSDELVWFDLCSKYPTIDCDCPFLNLTTTQPPPTTTTTTTTTGTLWEDGAVRPAATILSAVVVLVAASLY